VSIPLVPNFAQSKSAFATKGSRLRESPGRAPGRSEGVGGENAQSLAK
jgi:hypothetical protein